MSTVKEEKIYLIEHSELGSKELLLELLELRNSYVTTKPWSLRELISKLKLFIFTRNRTWFA